MKITFIQTGGTIDKDYPKALNSYGFEINRPAVEKVLKIANPNLEHEILSAMKKDSLDMTDKDRQRILELCERIENDKIVITHGTDTMVQTAKVLTAIKDKVIVLTGSMLPETFKDTDAEFNIGFATGVVQVLGNGVYIAMNCRVYQADKCVKNPNCQFVESN